MRPNGAVPRRITTVLYYDVIPHPTSGQHFNPISSPKRTVRHAWATLPRLSVARKHSGRPFREQNAAFRSRDNLGRPFREQNAPFRSRDNLGRPFREQIAPFRSRERLGRHSREQNAPSRSRDNLGKDPSVSRTRRFAHETAAKDTRGNRGAFSASYGNSMETLRGLYGRSSMPPRFDQSQWDS